ncbi:hypothetical protein Tcan_10965 [Toxocara canis]|uniref:Uncharacterized protein n=1 Tax=Toxocara canis TaxID=6265 RepID=A0A0B2VAL8_TOXCA|nr:hypothetical protein Tcan_10965 [Toxocara canis]
MWLQSRKMSADVKSRGAHSKSGDLHKANLVEKNSKSVDKPLKREKGKKKDVKDGKCTEKVLERCETAGRHKKDVTASTNTQPPLESSALSSAYIQLQPCILSRAPSEIAKEGSGEEIESAPVPPAAKNEVNVDSGSASVYFPIHPGYGVESR